MARQDLNIQRNRDLANCGIMADYKVWQILQILADYGNYDSGRFWKAWYVMEIMADFMERSQPVPFPAILHPARLLLAFRLWYPPVNVLWSAVNWR